MYSYWKRNDLFSVEQNGCCKNFRGAKNKLLTEQIGFKESEGKKEQICLWLG